MLSNARLTGLRERTVRNLGIAERRVLSSFKGEVHGRMSSEWVLVAMGGKHHLHLQEIRG